MITRWRLEQNILLVLGRVFVILRRVFGAEIDRSRGVPLPEDKVPEDVLRMLCRRPVLRLGVQVPGMLQQPAQQRDPTRHSPPAEAQEP